MSLVSHIRDDQMLETFKDSFGAYSTIRWADLDTIVSWVQHFTNEEATNYHRAAASVYKKGRAS